MLQYILRRLITAVPAILVVVVVSFLLIHLTPGDPAVVMLGPEASAADVGRLRSELGLDQPVYVQPLHWASRTAVGDLGDSLYLREPVLTALEDRFEPTLALTTWSLLLASVLGISLGIAAAVRRGSLADQAVIAFATLGFSIPAFWLGLVFILLFAVSLRWLPTSGYVGITDNVGSHLQHLVLPCLSLAFAEVALIARMTRSTLLEVLQDDFVRTARAKGLRERWVVVGHALRNAMLPLLTVLGVSVGTLIGGAVVIENVYNLPGLGRLITDSILRRDYPVIQGVVLYTALAYVLVNLVVDVLYSFADPRIRYG